MSTEDSYVIFGFIINFTLFKVEGTYHSFCHTEVNCKNEVVGVGVGFVLWFIAGGRWFWVVGNNQAVVILVLEY